MRGEQEIREELQKVLRDTPEDYARILELTNELSMHDKVHVRFSVDAGIISRLGKELVAKSETAISELIKNAYDAEATNAYLIFQNAVSVGGRLIIEDDGLGMSRNELINGFMRLSSSDKVHNPISPNYKRVKAGQKGIGRFATQRLGTKLTIITQTERDEYAIRTMIDWERYGIDINLNEISNSIETIEKQRSRGTTLIIDGLFESWSDTAIKRAYRNTGNLLLPEPLSKESKEWDESRTDPGFKVFFYREDKNEANIIVDEDKAFYNYSLAVIEGYVNERGEAFWKSNSNKLDIPHNEYIRIGKLREDEDSRYAMLHDIYFKTYYFIYETSLIPSTFLSYIKNLGNEAGGIKLYRNGFRVPPYGESGNDWLGLDESVRKRTFIFPHQNQSFFGFVEINKKASALFEETSSREGVIENEAYGELKDFVYRSITTACQEIAGIRNKKQTANQKDWEKKSPEERYQDAMSDLRKYAEEDHTRSGDESEDEREKRKERYDQYRRVFDNIDASFYSQKQQNDRLIDENNMLRVFAGLGLVLGEFIHEIKNYLPGFDVELKYLKQILRNNQDAFKRVERFDANMKSFVGYTAYFDKSISRNAHREIEPIDIKERIVSFDEVIKDNRSNANITLTTNLDTDSVLLADLWTVPMHPSEWASILFNLYTNAKKAIKKAHVTNGMIHIDCGECGNMVYVEFSDNGTGIDPRVKETLFDAFVTTTSTTSVNSDEVETYSGTGLGLKIIRDIVMSYNGNIYTMPPRDTRYKTTFRIEIPKYKEL